jgi:hypothetical protein
LKDLFIIIIFIFLFVFLYIRVSNTQSLEEIINKYIASRGGNDGLSAVKSVEMQGVRRMKGINFNVGITKVQNELFRTDLELQGNIGYQIVTSSRGWNHSIFQTYEAEEIPQYQLEPLKSELDIFGPLFNYRAKGYKAKFLGKDILYDRECYKIRLISQEKTESIYFIDCKTYLLLQSRKKLENYDKSFGRNIPDVITTYRDYKNFDGILFPQNIITEGFGTETDVLSFHTIKTNVDVDEKLYKPS